VLRPFDWAGNQLREETDKSKKAENVSGWVELFPVNVDRIAKGLKCVKAYTNRKDDLQGRNIGLKTEKGECRNKTIDKEITIFKEAEKPKIDQQTGCKQAFSFSGIGCCANFPSKIEINKRADDDQRQKAPIPVTVKEVADPDNENVP
jgi:hypothetical protein